jgi:predicted nuclease with TOPRIM domain
VEVLSAANEEQGKLIQGLRTENEEQGKLNEEQGKLIQGLRTENQALRDGLSEVQGKLSDLDNRIRNLRDKDLEYKADMDDAFETVKIWKFL